MASQVDALSSFVYLTDNIPSWLQEVEDLAAHTLKRHNEFAAEYSRLLKHTRPRKQRSPSMISHRSNDNKSDNEKPRSTKSNKEDADESFIEINPMEAGNKYLLANVRRKMKDTGASIRSGASGPQKFRHRHAVIVYYDSHVQNSFETMVKNISTARNNLRKGKKARALSRGLLMPSFNSFTPHLADFKRTMLMAQVNVNPKLNQTPKAPADEDACFDLADKDLEAAQQLCELAAHQFLRDGDSSVELQNTKERLLQALELAKETVEKLKEEEKAQKDLEEAETAVDEFEISVSEPKSIQPVSDDTTMAIEVDDDDDGHDPTEEFDINRYRAMMRPHAVRA